MPTVEERLQELRKEAGISQAKAAKLAGITQCVWSNYETKGVSPNVKVVIRIAKAFNVSADYILGLSDEKKPICKEDDAYSELYFGRIIERELFKIINAASSAAKEYERIQKARKEG